MRPPRDADVVWVAELLSRHAPEPWSAERVVREWSAPTIDPEEDVRLEDGASVLVDVEDERAWIYLAGDPSPELLAWAERRASERGATRLLSSAWEGAVVQQRRLEEAGFRRNGSSVRMRIDLDAELSPPAWPQGIEVRTFRDGDERGVYGVHLETFADLSEPMRASYEEWAHRLLQPPTFEPDRWFLAEAGDELAGIALCHVHPEVDAGVVAILGVRRPWRGRGLGRALLVHAFRQFARAGIGSVILGAESSSPTGADRLYESAGMRITHRRLRFEKALL